jgi:hypothetical protein
LFAALIQVTGKLIARTGRAIPMSNGGAFSSRLTPDAARARSASDCRQLRHSQASHGAGVTGQALALQHALHADLLVLTQPGRALLRRSDRRCDPRRQLCSVNQLVRDINAYLARPNANPKSCLWSAQGADILAKIKRARAALDNTQAA